jgi:hypothetical protein
MAGMAIFGTMGSVLLLAFRVGRLTGTMEARMSTSESDRVNIWKQLGALASKVDRHIEGHGR